MKDITILPEDGSPKLRLGWVVYEELGFWESETEVIDLRTNQRYTKLKPFWVFIDGFKDDLLEEWHPFCLCFDCARKLGWNGESYCVGQPKLRKEYNCDCCEKALTHEKSDSYTWKQALAMGLEKTTWSQILDARKMDE